MLPGNHHGASFCLSVWYGMGRLMRGVNCTACKEPRSGLRAARQNVAPAPTPILSIDPLTPRSSRDENSNSLRVVLPTSLEFSTAGRADVDTLVVFIVFVLRVGGDMRLSISTGMVSTTNDINNLPGMITVHAKIHNQQCHHVRNTCIHRWTSH